MTPDLPESPIATACAVAERVLFHERARDAALDELVHVLSETGLDSLQRELSNFRERQRVVAHWLDLFAKRVREVAP